MSDEGREIAIKEAKKAGLEIWDSDETKIQVDCDDLDSLRQCLSLYRSYKFSLRLLWAKVTLSKSGKWHVHIACDNKSVPERVAIQAALGSDPARELANLCDYDQNPKDVPLFFEVSGQTMWDLDKKYIVVQESRIAMERVRGKPFEFKELLEIEKSIRENL